MHVNLYTWFNRIFIYFRSFCQKFAKRKSQKNFFLYFVLMLNWCLNWGLTSVKPTHYPLEHGDFIRKICTPYFKFTLKNSFTCTRLMTIFFIKWIPFPSFFCRAIKRFWISEDSGNQYLLLTSFCRFIGKSKKAIEQRNTIPYNVPDSPCGRGWTLPIQEIIN